MPPTIMILQKVTMACMWWVMTRSVSTPVPSGVWWVMTRSVSTPEGGRMKRLEYMHMENCIIALSPLQHSVHISVLVSIQNARSLGEEREEGGKED